MNELKIFENTEFGTIRTMEDDGKVLFCGRDAAKALGYAKPENAISAHCKGTLKRGIPTQGGEQMMNFIPEGDLYRLIANSKLPSAEKFERWVFDEVLPSIRKHGAYMTPETIEAALLNPDTLIQLATTLKQEREQRMALAAKVEEDRPKVLFADAVDASHTSILIGDLAKLIRQNGVDIGQNRLFAWMRDNDYLIKAGERRNMPTQRAMDMELYEVKERTVSNPDGSVRITRTVKVTGKGQTYFINRFLAGMKEGA